MGKLFWQVEKLFSQYQPNFTISAKYHNFDQITQFQPNYHNQISQNQQNNTISAKYHSINKISQFQTNIHNLSQIS